jgi:hypothetical protein
MCREHHVDVPRGSRAHGVVGQDLEDGGSEVARIRVTPPALDR